MTEFNKPTQEKDWDALAEKQLASIKRDMKISVEDATVRAAHKVMAEFNDPESRAQNRKESVKAAVHTLTEYQRGYEDGFIGVMQKQTRQTLNIHPTKTSSNINRHSPAQGRKKIML